MLTGEKEERKKRGRFDGRGAGIGGRIAGKIDNNTAHDAWEGGGGEPTSKGGEEGFKFAINAGRNDRTRVTRTRG